MSEKRRECVEPPVLPRATPYYTFSSSVPPPPENAEQPWAGTAVLSGLLGIC